MGMILGTILLLTAVVTANVVHLVYPKIPLSIYQIIAGILLASLPTEATNFTMHPELFMMVIIAPLMFNDGQNQSFRYLSSNYKSILSMTVALALVTVLITGGFLHAALPKTFPLALAFMLAAIVTPTDAVAVKSITTNMKVPENVNGALEYESLFNDASGIVLLDLALETYKSGQFSLGHGIWIFVYVFFGGIIFGAILGSLLISLRISLMRKHVDIGSIVIPINVMTPIVIYWLAEEFHFSGILAVVAAGVIHSILYDRMRLTSTKVQMATTTIWTIISDALNGLVFVLLGVLLPQVLGRTSWQNLGTIVALAFVIYLITTVLRFLWVRFKLVNIHSSNITRDSLLMALGGIHGTITLALAFSLPVLINNRQFNFRNSMILIAAIVILISIAVGAIGYPLLLPPKAKSYSKTEFQKELVKTVQYAINELRSSKKYSPEKALVIDQLSSQMTQYHEFNRNVYTQLMHKAQQVELATLDRLNEEDKISNREAKILVGFVTRSAFRMNKHGFLEFWVILWHRIKWRFMRQRLLNKRRHDHDNPPAHFQLTEGQRTHLASILTIINRDIDKFLHSVETPQNANEVAMVRRSYFQRKRMFSHEVSLDTDLATSLFIEAFQLEHSYVQMQLSDNQFSQELANALNEQISTDELVFAQSLD
ncbi:sodium:proton antiporter [Limosilactobacillus sp. STM2_1]|uniref:Sodium:proton antiporter n=1 Tax=Limosilactobacillus rudii TaxID=2759755 RepID=A0A7W3UL41_9LACO|nr:sodium:proton antiporter [Limosilactobacillus rudii]MBB1079493.1 sodium:proton antiporter [Limosilactobacillus rudii]MBB1097539.1 sodium:proton antiporter [Limosilactobacillus rudii]MCD7134649.1 sodium:proton antiporter [Limosilactobacillus rudii]